MSRSYEAHIEELRRLLKHATIAGDHVQVSQVERELEHVMKRAEKELYHNTDFEHRVMGKWDAPINRKISAEDFNHMSDSRTPSPVPTKIAPVDAYHHSSSNPNCPHCGSSTSPQAMGNLEVDGGSRPIYHCASCNRVYSDIPQSIKVLMDKALEYGAENVGFEAVVATGNASNASSSGSSYQMEQNTQQANYKLDSVNSNLMSLRTTLQELINQIGLLANQNNILMEQLATDPMVAIRKSISEFNLK